MYIKEQFAPFPAKLAAMCSKIGDLIGDGYSIKPDAAIINFYPVTYCRRFLKLLYLSVTFSPVCVLNNISYHSTKLFCNRYLFASNIEICLMSCLISSGGCCHGWSY